MSDVEVTINTRTIEIKEVVLTLSVELANALNSVLYLVEGSSSDMRRPLFELSATLDRLIGTPHTLPSGCVDFDQMEDHRPKQAEKPGEPEETRNACADIDRAKKRTADPALVVSCCPFCAGNIISTLCEDPDHEKGVATSPEPILHRCQVCNMSFWT